MSARIVVSEIMDEPALARLRERHEVHYDPTLVDDLTRLAALAADCDALIVRNRTPVRGDVLAALKRCKVIGRLGVGLDNIDMPGCEAQGLRVIPATGANARSVAEYVIAAGMLLLRGAFASSADVAAGRWPRNALGLGRETAGKTLGIIGFGSIGQTVAGLARGLGMDVIAFDAGLGPGHAVYAQAGVRFMPLEELIAAADAVTLHVPLADSTRGLLNAARLARMKKGAILINTSRGHIVDVPAVVEALRQGRLGGAALDVFDVEPLPASSLFDGCPNLVLTPHISGVTAEANERVSMMIADKVLEVLG